MSAVADVQSGIEAAETTEIIPVVELEETVEEFLARTRSGYADNKPEPGSERSHDGSTADTFNPNK